jgi:hypothetical protein
LLPEVLDRIPLILADVEDQLGELHADYLALLAEEPDKLTEAVRTFLGRLVGSVYPTGGADVESTVDGPLYEEFGAEHYRQGRDVSALLAVYRSAAAAGWRHISQAALAVGVPNGAIAALATSLFTAVDRLSAASLRGYMRERSGTASDRERSRDELADLLLSPSADGLAVRTLAVRAGWRLPELAALVLIDGDNQLGREVLMRLGGAALRVRRADAHVAIVPDPSGASARLRAELSGVGAVVGTPVRLGVLPASLQTVRLAARLRRAGVLRGDPLFVVDNLDTLIVHQDAALLAELRRTALAPLEGMAEPRRERLLETLHAWLVHMGNQKAVANALFVHPQTVRYRLAQLRELYGPRLDDPATRARLLLALAWSRGKAA